MNAPEYEERVALATRLSEETAAKRTCGDCRACCTILGVLELKKPTYVACKHECSAGCAVYAERPPTCAEFLCLWRAGWGTEDMRPDQCGYMLWVQDSERLYRHVQGRDGTPPAIVTAFAYRSFGVFTTVAFRRVRDGLLRMGVPVMTLFDSTVWIYGERFPRGVPLHAKHSVDKDSVPYLQIHHRT